MQQYNLKHVKKLLSTLKRIFILKSFKLYMQGFYDWFMQALMTCIFFVRFTTPCIVCFTVSASDGDEIEWTGAKQAKYPWEILP